MLFIALDLSKLRYKVDVSLLFAFKNEFRYTLQENTQRENIEIEITLCWTLSYSCSI